MVRLPGSDGGRLRHWSVELGSCKRPRALARIVHRSLCAGLAGGSASGKTTVARRVIESLGVPWVSVLSMDSFYRVLTPSQSEQAAKNEYDFDHPGAPSEPLTSDPLPHTLCSFPQTPSTLR